MLLIKKKTIFFRYDRPTILYGVNLWLTPIPAIAARIFFNENTLKKPTVPYHSTLTSSSVYIIHLKKID